MKRIIICADGTWNERDQVDKETGKRRPTNVTKILRAVLPRDGAGVDQIVCYDEGLGTGGGLDHLTGGAFGSGIEDNIRQLYRFILYNYVDGDELYFFGFSRGAFTVRTLAGFMNEVGLIQKDYDYFLPDIYGCYEAGAKPGSPAWTHAFRKLPEAKRRSSPPIKFIGVFDTVGALGAPGLIGQLFNSGKYKYHNVELVSPIEHACQALAIDERRKSFKPSVWSVPQGWTGRLEQKWFAGVHSDVGGSYTPDGLANIALHWMVERAQADGLAFDATYLKPFMPCFDAVLHDSMSFKFRLLGEHVRDVNASLASGASLHPSVGDRMLHTPSRYAPKNVMTALGGQLPLGSGAVPCGW